jgi:hypothetical protein
MQMEDPLIESQEEFDDPEDLGIPEEIDSDDESYHIPQPISIGQAFVTPEDDDEDDDDEDEDESDVNYLQKFDEVTQQTIISDFHPELQFHNYHEIDILSRVVRNEKGQIIDPLHKTLPFITRYEIR